MVNASQADPSSAKAPVRLVRERAPEGACLSITGDPDRRRALWLAAARAVRAGARELAYGHRSAARSASGLKLNDRFSSVRKHTYQPAGRTAPPPCLPRASSVNAPAALSAWLPLAPRTAATALPCRRSPGRPCSRSPRPSSPAPRTPPCLRSRVPSPRGSSRRVRRASRCSGSLGPPRPGSNARECRLSSARSMVTSARAQ